MNTIVVIPARYQSSRFLGKPLALLKGKPMIWHVWGRATQIKIADKVIVATDYNRSKTNPNFRYPGMWEKACSCAPICN